MKSSFLIAAALIAAPAFAQTATPATDTGAAAQTAPATPDMSAAPQTAPADPAAQQTAPAPATGAMGNMTPGGYQPSAPAMQGTMTPGVTPTFQAAPSPSQAYPAPAPAASYPPCKKGQYDQCTQVSGSHMARKHRK